MSPSLQCGLTKVGLVDLTHFDETLYFAWLGRSSVTDACEASCRLLGFKKGRVALTRHLSHQ